MDERNQSFRYHHLYRNKHHMDVHLLFHEEFNRSFKTIPCFRYMYEAICYIDDGRIVRNWAIHFNNPTDKPNVLGVHFKPGTTTIELEVGYYYLDSEKSTGYIFHIINKKHLTNELQRFIDDFTDVIITLPPLRLLHVTGSLEIVYRE